MKREEDDRGGKYEKKAVEKTGGEDGKPDDKDIRRGKGDETKKKGKKVMER